MYFDDIAPLSIYSLTSSIIVEQTIHAFIRIENGGRQVTQFVSIFIIWFYVYNDFILNFKMGDVLLNVSQELQHLHILSMMN